MSSELKPCPFCGGEAAKVKGVGFKVHGVVCTKCPCEVAWFSSEQEAVNLWNQRAERTCKNVGGYIDTTRLKCSECGFNGWVRDASIGDDVAPSYCPNCGAKVVGD